MSEQPDIPIIRNHEYEHPDNPKPGKLIAASVLRKGRLWTNKRHAFCLQDMLEDLSVGKDDDDYDIDEDGERIIMGRDMQGFYTENGYHVGRIPASAIAQSEGQIPIEFDKILTSRLW